MGVYEKLQASALGLITKFGRTFVLTATGADKDTDVPWRGSVQDETLWPTASVKGLFASFTSEEINGERVRSDDVKVLVAAADTGWGTNDPASFSLADDGGKRFSVKMLDAVKPGELPILYTLRLRGIEA